MHNWAPWALSSEAPDFCWRLLYCERCAQLAVHSVLVFLGVQCIGDHLIQGTRLSGHNGGGCPLQFWRMYMYQSKFRYNWAQNWTLTKNNIFSILSGKWVNITYLWVCMIKLRVYYQRFNLKSNFIHQKSCLAHFINFQLVHVLPAEWFQQGPAMT